MMESGSKLPSGWAQVPIAEVIEKPSLTGIKLKQSEYQEEGLLPVIDQGQKFIGGFTDQEELKVLCKLPVIVFGDHTKVFKYVNFNFVAGADGVKVLKPLDLFNPKLFYYFLQAVELPDKGYARHFQFLEKSDIPIPPIFEQHRIVGRIEELFSRLDAGVEALQKAKAQLKSYRQAVLKAAVEGKLTEEWRKAHPDIETADELLERIRSKECNEGNRGLEISDLPDVPNEWMWANLGEIGNVSGGLTKNSKRNNFPLKIPYLRVANVYAGELRLDEMKEIGLGENELERVLLNPGDLLIVEGNGSADQIGRVSLWDGSISPCVHQNHIIKVRFEPTSIGKYVLYWLLSISGREQINKVASSTSGLYTLSISKVASLLAPLPPRLEQEKIVNEIENRLSIVDQEYEIIDRNILIGNHLRQSILKRAFEGRLVPQDPNDEPASVLLDRIKYEKAIHAPKSGKRINRNTTHQMRLTQ
jgi:type I restriction enzyme, S subunit